MIPPIVIEVQSVTKRFTLKQDSSVKERILSLGRGRAHFSRDFTALDDVSLEIRAGETIGLIGHNGSGKSTLLKMIGGILEPTSGVVRTRGRVAALLELGAGFHPDLTGRENVYLNAALLGMTREETAAQYEAIVGFADIADFMDTQVKFYSSGMFIRLAFAVAVHTNPDILLVDEVLAVGDEAFQRRCFERIEQFRQSGCTIVLVSHSLDQIQQLCNRAVLLHHGAVNFIGDSAEAVRLLRERLDEDRIERFGIQGFGNESFSFGEISIAPLTEHNTVRQAECVTVRIPINSTVELLNASVAVWIESVAGQEVFGVTGHGAPGRTDLRAGENLFEVQFPNGIPLGVGHYYLGVVLVDSEGHHLRTQRQALPLDFEHIPRSWGLLGVDTVISQVPPISDAASE